MRKLFLSVIVFSVIVISRSAFPCGLSATACASIRVGNLVASYASTPAAAPAGAVLVGAAGAASE